MYKNIKPVGGSTVYYMGCDPGSQGGIVIIDSYGAVYTVINLGTSTDLEVVEGLREFMKHSTDEPYVFAVLEDTVHMSAEKKGAVKYGENCGFLRGVLTALSIPFERAAPQKWKRALGIKMGGENQVEKKRRSKAKAQQLCPSVKWTNNTAEAYLLAVYAQNFGVRRLLNKEKGT
jgi:hypothetical protein